MAGNIDGLSVVASSWAFSGDNVIPYEFSTEAEEIDLGKHKAFLGGMSRALHSSGLIGNLALYSAESIAESRPSRR